MISPSTMFPDEQPGMVILPEALRENALYQLRDNKGVLFATLQGLAMQANGDPDVLRATLATVLCEVSTVPISMISDVVGLDARTIMEVRKADPISMFACIGCRDTLPDPTDRRHLLRQDRALRQIVRTDAGQPVETETFYELLCGVCENEHHYQRAEQFRAEWLAHQARKRELSTMPFSEYQETREWKIKRSRALIRAGNKCQLCASVEKPLNVHHNSYERYGDELLEDLTVLCRACHKRHHGIRPEAA